MAKKEKTRNELLLEDFSINSKENFKKLISVLQKHFLKNRWMNLILSEISYMHVWIDHNVIILMNLLHL